MYVDNFLMFSKAQVVTEAVNSTSHIDLGSAYHDIGVGEDLYIVVQVETTLTDGGSNTGTLVTLQSDSDVAFGSATTAVQTLGSFDDGAVAGTQIVHRIAPGITERYINLRYAPAGANLTGGKFTAFITTNPSMWSAKPNADLASLPAE
jgi:hypothetical protein